MAAGLLGIRVVGLGPVCHTRLRSGVPAAVVLRLGPRLLGIRVVLGRSVLLLLLLRLLPVLLVLVLHAVRLLVVGLLRVLLLVLLGRVLRVLVLLVLVLLGVRVLRIGLLLVAVLALAVGGLPFPSLVPVQGVLGMPRFGAGAPAILSHRSPRAARRCSVSSLG